MNDVEQRIIDISYKEKIGHLVLILMRLILLKKFTKIDSPMSRLF